MDKTEEYSMPFLKKYKRYIKERRDNPNEKRKVLFVRLGIIVLSLYIYLSVFEGKTSGLIVGAVLGVVLLLLEEIFLASVYPEYTYDEERGVMVAAPENAPMGNAAFMTEEEEEAIFDRYSNIRNKDCLGKIFGIDPAGMLVSVKDDIVFTNKNTAIIGYPGSGKSACIVNTHIYQSIRANKSIILTDSKGSLYTDTAGYARRAGYNIKVLNLKPKEIKNSDGVELMKTITDQMGAETMANIIMENSSDGGEKKDFWYKCELNLLKALILKIKFSSTIPENEKTLIKVYETLIGNGVDELTSIMADTPPEHPAYSSALSFARSKDDVKESAYGGLCIKLSLLAQPAVQAMLSYNEIDLKAPYYEKCAYYVIISDTDSSAKFLACLFFTTLFNELIGEYDAKFDRNPTAKPIDIEFILDEFPATGAIPNFNNILSVARSRHLNIEFIMQDITQLQAMYPEGWHTIMNDCIAWCCIASREPETLKYLGELNGERTIITENKAFQRSDYALIDYHPVQRVMQGTQKQNLMGAYEIYRMPRSKLLFMFAGEAPIILDKYFFWNHPAYNFIKKNDLFENPKAHIPVWRQVLIDEGRDIQDTYIPNDITSRGGRIDAQQRIADNF